MQGSWCECVANGAEVNMKTGGGETQGMCLGRGKERTRGAGFLHE